MAETAAKFSEVRKEALKMAESAAKDFPPLLKRDYQLTRHVDASKKGCQQFRVLQWNVLADALSESSPTSNFIRCPPEALTWSDRKHRLLQGILTYQPDIICLEEVDHYHDFFQLELENIGYQGMFCPKGDSPCLKVPGNSGPDGLALFFDKEKYILKEHLDKRLEGTEGLSSQVCILVKLYDQINENNLYCGVTHLKAKAEFKEMRFAQGKSMLASLKDFIGDDNAEVIICGDFNADPSEQVYQIVEDGVLTVPLSSAYKTATHSEPEYTTWKIRPRGRMETIEVKHTIDYVWHSGGLGILGYLATPHADVMGPGRLPCMEYPSDHVSLVFDMLWI